MESIGQSSNVVKGLDTCNNDVFLRQWSEVNYNKIGFNINDNEFTFNHKWFPYSKGGGYRKWYGNNAMVVDWEDNGAVLRNLKTPTGKLKARPQNMKYYFKEGLTFSSISSKALSIRYMENSIFGGGGSGLFTENSKFAYFYLAILNSKVSQYILDIVNPTMNKLVGDLLSIPIPDYNDIVSDIAKENIGISKIDWDSFETSWDFKLSPLIKPQNSSILIEDNYISWVTVINEKYDQLKENEEELNRIFIDIYGLEDELTPEVSERDITITRIYDDAKDIPEEIKGNQYVLTKKDVIQQFISYAVGCMFGRYSLDEDGLVYAGGEFDASRYETYGVVEDNIIPITSDVYLEDDLVNRFIKFVETVYGKETLEENLGFIAEALGQKKNETTRDTIHRYFLNDFFKDHARMYSVTGSGRRPIYWKFTSGKENAFNCFIYMHRYDKTTISRIRTEYLHDVQQRLETRKIDLDQILNSDASTTELNKARKEMKTVEKQLAELVAYDEKLRHMADQQIEIDLDDGFKVNYPKFKGLVEKV